MISNTFSQKLRSFKENPVLIVCRLIYVVIWIYYAINPAWRPQWWLDNYMVFGLVLLLSGTHKRFPLSDVSYILIAMFLSLHAVGAHYSYSHV